ncbi:MAG TPA: hypothetical protein VG102_02805 [Candidatus Paceibacterota bacterium]|jgi:hypothetical protein|nr:hypothetical protein [Candidatus Paceibacterota bacterium]
MKHTCEAGKDYLLTGKTAAGSPASDVIRISATAGNVITGSLEGAGGKQVSLELDPLDLRHTIVPRVIEDGPFNLTEIAGPLSDVDVEGIRRSRLEKLQKAVATAQAMLSVFQQRRREGVT